MFLGEVAELGSIGNLAGSRVMGRQDVSVGVVYVYRACDACVFVSLYVCMCVCGRLCD